MDTLVLADTEYYQGGRPRVISDRESVSGNINSYTWIHLYWPTLNTIRVADQVWYVIEKECQGTSTRTHGYPILADIECCQVDLPRVISDRDSCFVCVCVCVWERERESEGERERDRESQEHLVISTNWW